MTRINGWTLAFSHKIGTGKKCCVDSFAGRNMQKAAGLGVSARFLQTESLFVAYHGCADTSIFHL